MYTAYFIIKNIEKNIQICNLIDTYERLLTSKQKDILQKFYYYDNSLSEIAEEYGTTRQAVSDLIKRTETILLDYEEKLKLNEKYQEILSLVNDVMYGDFTEKEKKKKINNYFL